MPQCPSRRARRGLVCPGTPCGSPAGEYRGRSGFSGRSGGRGSTKITAKPVSSTIFSKSGSNPVPLASPTPSGPGAGRPADGVWPGTGGQSWIVASIVNRQAKRPSAQLAWPALAGAVCPGARFRACAKGSRVPRCPLLDRGPEDVWEDPGFRELLVHGNPTDPPASPDPPGKSGNPARLPSRLHHPPPPHQAAWAA